MLCSVDFRPTVRWQSLTMGDKSGEKQVDAKIIKKTQDTLGRIVKKPPLTDKLLQKPPFRFLHDIVTSVSILML